VNVDFDGEHKCCVFVVKIAVFYVKYYFMIAVRNKNFFKPQLILATVW